VDDLVKKYPDFFAKQNIGFHVGPGWVHIIEDAIKLMIIQELKSYPQAVQIKEKFGGLRWYTNSCTAEQQKIIDSAERVCGMICEKCGEPGTLAVSKGWYKTVCDKHKG